MKKIIRLTENDLHRIVGNSVKRIIKEIGGVYPDGQMDMFLDQDGVDEYRSQSNNGMIQGLLKAEKMCGWGHSATKDMGNYTVYTCYPKNGMHKSRQEFMDAIINFSPRKNSVHFISNRGTMTDVFMVRIDNI